MPEIHGMADIGENISWGALCHVWSFAVVCDGVTLGDCCVVGSHVYIGKNTILGHDVRMQDGAHLTDHMIVGNGVFFGAGCKTMNDKYPKVKHPNFERNPPCIEDDVSIGCGAVILPGVRLGHGCLIGAGAIVAHDVPPGMIVYGGYALPRRMRAMYADNGEHK